MQISYSCPGCFKVYDKFDDLDTHRRAVHGRDGYGNLVFDARPAIDQRLAAIEDHIASLHKEIAALRKALEDRA